MFASYIFPLRQKVNVRKLAGSSLRDTHRVSFCLGTTMVLGFWNTSVSGTIGPAAASSASQAKISIFLNKVANLKVLHHGKAMSP